MTTSCRISVAHLLSLAVLAGSPWCPAAAQATPETGSIPPTLALYAGAWNVDLRGSTGGVRLELPRARNSRWTWVAALTYFDPNSNSPHPTTVVTPEALVQYELTQSSVRPYLGAGAGVSFGNLINSVDPVMSVATGLQADISDEWGVRLDGGLRMFGRVRVGTLAWSLGVARRL